MEFVKGLLQTAMKVITSGWTKKRTSRLGVSAAEQYLSVLLCVYTHT